MDIPDWCEENLLVKDGLIRKYIGENNDRIIQLITTLGGSYRTSLADERNFQFLVKQVNGDKLSEIRYSDVTILDWMKNSETIGEWIKSRIALNINFIK